MRVALACRELNIASVAVYSDADADSFHASVADEAFRIGPPTPAQSYLAGDVLVRTALSCGADAIHPGYGFLAENASFARAVTDAGLTWIGPPATAMELMGDKIAAKSCAVGVGVPVLGGYTGDDQSSDRLRREAERIGLPVMIKAAAGGGGRGMRAVAVADELDDSIEAARREAISAFGDGRLFLERLLPFPRHIEIQILGDTIGSVVHLGERDCSAQRRHQKVLEESPSPVLTGDLRRSMGAASVRLARAVGYVGAGTVEFLFANDSFHFLEMNTRIQVEHPVTEEITGVDLVKWQIKIAAGEKLGFSQHDITMRGHAIEARVYGEVPEHHFLPSTGTISTFVLPSGPGVRNDVGVQAGSEVSQHYDSLLGKLVVHAATREEARCRLLLALERYEILGIATNLRFLRWLADSSEFRHGRVDVGFIDRSWTAPNETVLPPEVLWLATAFVLLRYHDHVDTVGERFQDPWTVLPAWRHSGQSTSLSFRLAERVEIVRAIRLGAGRLKLDHNGQELAIDVSVTLDNVVTVRLADRVLTAPCLETENDVQVSWRGQAYTLIRGEPGTDALDATAGSPIQAGLASPTPATVVKVTVQDGDRVIAQQPLVVLEAMKTEHVVHAPRSGVVHLLFAVGDLVPAGAAVARVEEE